MTLKLPGIPNIFSHSKELNEGLSAREIEEKFKTVYKSYTNSELGINTTEFMSLIGNANMSASTTVVHAAVAQDGIIKNLRTDVFSNTNLGECTITLHYFDNSIPGFVTSQLQTSYTAEQGFKEDLAHDVPVSKGDFIMLKIVTADGVSGVFGKITAYVDLIS